MMTRWVSENELRFLTEQTKNIENEDLKEDLWELNKLMPNKWFIEPIEKTSFFKKKVFYSVLYKLTDFEVQIINFHIENSSSSICSYVPLDVVNAFLGGILAGIEIALVSKTVRSADQHNESGHNVGKNQAGSV